MNNNFLNAIKKALPKIKKEKFSIWQQEMEYEITHSFLFNNVYAEEEINGVETLKDLNGLHDINGYKTLEDFIYTLTGEQEKDEEYGFRSYYVSLKEDWLENLFTELDMHLEKEKIKGEEIIVNLEDSEFKELLVKFTDSFWVKWLKKDFKEIIDNNYVAAWNEDKESSMVMDMNFKEESQRFQQFQGVVVDYLNFLDENEISTLRSKDKAMKAKVQEWAKHKNYEELSLFEEFYPKDKSLKEFKWLDKKIYEEKFLEKDIINQSIESIFNEHGLTMGKTLISSHIKKLYELRDEVFSIKGEKVVYVHNSNKDMFLFSLDEYNRVNGCADGISDFTNILEEILNDIGSIIIRKFSDDKYLNTSNDEMILEPVFDIYGAMVLDGKYKGLTHKELKNICEINSSDLEGMRFLDWNIGYDGNLGYGII